MASFLPYARQSIDRDDVDAVVAALESDFLTTGPMVARFEDAFAAATGAANAVVCANGTAALHLSALALGLCAGDTVIVPAVTFLATANAVRYAGAEVLFADVDPDTGVMGEAQFGEALQRARREGRPVRAVFPVHLAGQCADPQRLHAIARGHALSIVEDACHALGADYGGDDGRAHRVGACSHSDAAVFSLHPAKTVTMGEGGVVTTADPAFAARLRRLRNHGMVREAEDFLVREQALDVNGAANPWYYEMHDLGFNYRATDMQCALGLSQLRRLSEFVERRRVLTERYDQALRSLRPTVRPLARLPGCAPAWHLYVALVDFERAGRDRAALMRRLHELGVGTQVHYLPVYRQPYYRERYGEQRLPGAEAYYRRCISLPLWPGMQDADVGRVVSALGEALGNAR